MSQAIDHQLESLYHTAQVLVEKREELMKQKQMLAVLKANTEEINEELIETILSLSATHKAIIQHGGVNETSPL